MAKVHPNSIANLKPIKKGEVRSTKTRKQNEQIKLLKKALPDLNELLTNLLTQEKSGKSAAEAMLQSLLAEAVNGKGMNKVAANKLIIERAWGLPEEKVEHTIKRIVIKQGGTRD